MEKLLNQNIQKIDKISKQATITGSILSIATAYCLFQPILIQQPYLVQALFIGILLTLSGPLLTYLTKKYLQRTIIIQEHDPLFEATKSYLLEKKYIDDNFLKQALATLQYRSKNRDEHYIDAHNVFEKQDKLKEKPKVAYTPINDSSSFIYQNTKIFIIQQLVRTATCSYKQLILSTNDYKSFKILKNLCDEIIEHNLIKEKDVTAVYTVMDGYSWQKMLMKIPRSIESVILPQKISDTIQQDVKKFFSRENWYKQRGVPYRRGYLLYGPPGSGKTSYVYALAGVLQMNICVVNLNSQYLSDEGLMNLLHKTPPKSILLLEDVDTLYDFSRKRINQSSVTFSGFLNCLDGVLAQEGHIMFMTTNHKENLDPALKRPGRADVHVKLDFACRFQVEKLFLNFYEGETELAEKFASKIPEFKVSMANLQNHFMTFSESGQEALDQIQVLFDELKKQEEEEAEKKKKEEDKEKKKKKKKNDQEEEQEGEEEEEEEGEENEGDKQQEEE